MAIPLRGIEDLARGNLDLKDLLEKKKPVPSEEKNALRMVLSGSTTYVGESKYFEKQVEELSFQDRDVCRIKKIMTFPVRQKRSLVFVKEFPYARFFDLLLLKIQEVGIFHLIAMKWYPRLGSYCKSGEIFQLGSISLGILWLPFIILSSAYFLSLAFFCCELLRKAGRMKTGGRSSGRHGGRHVPS